MGLKFRRSINVSSNLKLNINKGSVGFTVGTKGAHYTVNSKGRTTTTVGLPGTGLSYSNISTGKKHSESDSSYDYYYSDEYYNGASDKTAGNNTQPVGLSKGTKRYCIIALILAYITLTGDLLLFATGNTLLGILFCFIFLIECASIKLATVMDPSYLKSTASKVKQTPDTTHLAEEKHHGIIYNTFDGAKGTRLTIIIFKILSFIAFVFIVLTAYLGEFGFMFVFAVQLVIYIIVITFCEESLKM